MLTEELTKDFPPRGIQAGWQGPVSSVEKGVAT
jgi:hypothetical protein